MIEKKRPDISTNRYKKLLWFEKNYEKMQKENFKNIKENNKLRLELYEKCKTIDNAIEFINSNKFNGAKTLNERYLDDVLSEELIEILAGEE